MGIREFFDILRSTTIYNAKPIVAGSFPAYYYMYKKGWIEEIPKDIDIDIYCVASNFNAACKLYNSIMCHFDELKSTVDRPVQIMKPEETDLYTTWAKHPYLIISQFDISIARMWMEDENTIKWIRGEDPLYDIENRRIRIMRVVNPIKEMYRVMKYVRRGWEIDKEDIIKVFLEWDNLSQDKKASCINQMGVESYKLSD